MSPDTEDPEAVGGAGEKAVKNQEKGNAAGGIERASTRTWAEEIGYDPVKLFNKVSFTLLLLLLLLSSSSLSQLTFLGTFVWRVDCVYIQVFHYAD